MILVLLAGSAGEIALSRVLSAHPVALLVLVPALIIAAVVLGVRKVRRGGEPLRDVLHGRRQRGRARVDSADKLRVEAPPAHRRSPASWLAEFGIEANRDLILVSPGSRKALVINAVITLTGMRPREARDLIDNAPEVVLRQVTSERADRAKEVLEALGATVTVRGDPDQF